MLRKLMIVILAGVVFCGFFSSNIVAETFEKITPEKIPLDQIVPSSPTHPSGDKGFCLIQSDNDIPAYYFATFEAGDGFALYMDPAKCGLPDPYPFKITDVHFYLYEASSTWPVEIQVNIRDLIEGDKYNGPGDSLCSQIYTIDSLSAYPNLIQLDLDSLCCVYNPFFLEIIYTGGTSSPYPSLTMTDETTNPTDTCDAWVWYFLEDQHYYFEWSDFWKPPPTGYPIMRITGYTQQCHPESCWYWKDSTESSPSGMPDFDQNQFGVDSSALCAPTAVANCLWWYDAVPEGMNPADLIRLLCDYFHTDPDNGTYMDSIESGLDRYFKDYGFNLYENTFYQPYFEEMEDSLKRSQDIILLLSFWQYHEEEWHCFAGHAVTMAGVCSESLKVALSDPDRDAAVGGFWPGRVTPEHPLIYDPPFHNAPVWISHDMYQSDTISPSPGNPHWGLPDYFILDKVHQYEGKNLQPWHKQYFHPYEPGKTVYTEVDGAIMICPGEWYWKPDRPDQDHPAPSGMPDFDQNQDQWQAYCGPTAVANCLWWYDAVPEGWTPPELIELLAEYFHTNPSWGTYVDTMQMGLEQYFQDFGQDFEVALQESTFRMPDFVEMEDSLKACQDIILLLGFWEEVLPDSFERVGGHYVTMAGVCSESLKIAVSDPYWDNAESDGPGRVRPPHDPHPTNDTLHNDPAYVSQDIYTSTLTSPSPGNPYWGLLEYPLGKSFIQDFIGKNFHTDQLQYYHPNQEVKGPIFVEVDYAVMICPKTTGVEEEEGESAITPKDFELYQSYPNPFNNQTIINYNLLKSCQVTLTIYNILGQKVKTLVNERQETGPKSIGWGGKDETGKDLASGIYFYQLKAGEVTQTKRMVLLK